MKSGTGREKILDAVDQLKREIHYFDQLASRFPDHSKGLKKHSNDCRLVASNLQNKMQAGSADIIETSVRTANVFLQEGHRLRLKLRVDLLKQQATSLELEASRWAPLKSQFRALAQECRQVALGCRNNIYAGSASEVEMALEQANEFYEKSTSLRKQQRKERRQDRINKLRRRIVSLNDEQGILSKKATEMPTYARKLEQLSKHCQQAAKQLEGKANLDSVGEIERYLRSADNFLKRVRLNRKNIDRHFHAATMPEVKPVVVEFKKPTSKQAANDGISPSLHEALAEEVETDLFEVTQPIVIDIEKKKVDIDEQNDKDGSGSAREAVVRKAGDNLFKVKSTLEAEPETIKPGFRKDKTIQFSVTSEILKQNQHNTIKRYIMLLEHSMAKFARKAGSLLLFLVGSVLVVTFLLIVLYLSGAGFSSIGLF